MLDEYYARDEREKETWDDNFILILSFFIKIKPRVTWIFEMAL